MRDRRDFYRILHVQPDAPTEIVRTSYRTLMQAMKMHPDLGGDHGEAALINEAFATLRDPDKRAAYDRMLSETPDASADVAAEAAPRPKAPNMSRAPRPAARELGRTRTPCAFCGEPHSTQDASQPTAVCWRCQSPICPPVQQPRTPGGRAFDRMSHSVAVDIRLAPPADVSFSATTEDLSITGARLIVSADLALGQRLRLDCAGLTAVGVVRHVQAEPDSRPAQWRIGVEFLTLLVKKPRGVFVSTHV